MAGAGVHAARARMTRARAPVYRRARTHTGAGDPLCSGVGTPSVAESEENSRRANGHRAARAHDRPAPGCGEGNHFHPTPPL